ncbi:MAG: minor capsid protein, partial [Clostridia bacterium]|nr:minor capsid protein [Clostridia bacterium]
DITKIRYVDTIKEGYYHNIYDIQKGTGISFSFSQLDNRTINLMLNKKWFDNKNYSQRIWKNQEKLSNYISINMSADNMSGKSIQKISQELSEFMNVGLFNATRLVRTEMNYFANESEMIAYEELEIERYRYIATLDKKTCKHCSKLDNKVFYVKDRKPR